MSAFNRYLYVNFEQTQVSDSGSFGPLFMRSCLQLLYKIKALPIEFMFRFDLGLLGPETYVNVSTFFC